MFKISGDRYRDKFCAYLYWEVKSHYGVDYLYIRMVDPKFYLSLPLYE